ncbi:hypothetical protein N5T80_02855 [Aliarcobacter cryaerophilus]|uniref:hypothetical protein n=1 Tax=Aliarcobacter cryaerophilus TaxID=28198 RepID=UPI0021B64C0C|nr:hypothetical protein [Aliarcobacter cryaerophilus]MCT7545253.1 hypothetical protein [Aliarcobacter cryaerophilus]
MEDKYLVASVVNKCLINKFVSVDYNSSFLMILFDKLNSSSPMLTANNFHKYYHSENLKESYINDGLNVFDSWNQYSALNDFFKLILSSEFDNIITKEMICDYIKKNIDFEALLKNNDFIMFDTISLHESIKKLYSYIINNELMKFYEDIYMFSKKCRKFKILILFNFTTYIDNILKDYTCEELRDGYLKINKLKFELCILLRSILCYKENINEFIFKWIRRNCKIITENIFDNISSEYIKQDVLLKNLDNYRNDFLNTVLENNQMNFVKKCFDKSISRTSTCIKKIFKLNFLKNYSEKEKDKIITDTFQKVKDDLLKNFLLYNDFVLLLENIFQDKSIKRDIVSYLENDKENKNEIESNILYGFLNHMYLLDYDIVKKGNYLDNLYKIMTMNQIMKLISNRIKSSKSDKKKRCIDFLKKNKMNYKYAKFDYLIDALIFRLDLSNKFYALVILETLSKLFNFDYLNNKTLINDFHRDFNLNKETATKYREVIANKTSFVERTALFSKIHFNQN